MKTRVYIAGPISRGCLQSNINAARDAGLALVRAGYAPLVPHLSCFMANNDPKALPAGTSPEDWYSLDLSWVAVSHVVLRLPGESVGADGEVALANRLGIPVFHDLDTLILAVDAETPGQDCGHPMFHALLEKMRLMHASKGHDYGQESDPFANVRAAREFGVAPWLGAVLRGNDKMTRLKSFAQKGNLKNESVQDSLLDLACYCLIGLVLFEEEVGAGGTAKEAGGGGE